MRRFRVLDRLLSCIDEHLRPCWTGAIMAEYKFIKLSVEDGVGIIQLNHFEKRNALGWEMHEEIPRALEQWIGDDAVACVLFIGNEEIFCGGWALDVLSAEGGKVLTKFTDIS